MFFQPETSLIPGVLALSGFFIENFPNISWYPYWYLGNPFHYLIGPVVPSLLFILQKLTGTTLLNLNILYYCVISAGILIGAVGVYFLVRGWEKENFKFTPRGTGQMFGILAGALYIVLPFSWLGLYFQNGLKNVAFALVPFVFIVYRNFLKPKSNFINYFFLVILITVCLLITINILLALIIGFIAVFISVDRVLPRQENSKKKNLWAWREDKIVQTILIIFLALSLVTFWYTPRFWWVLLTNPSFGGVPLWNFIVIFFQSTLNFLPLVLAILAVRWRTLGHRISGSLFFAYLFFSSFLFLTGARFLADPDFVIDWIGFLPELQFGAAILLTAVFIKLRNISYLSYLSYLGYIIILIFAGISGILCYNLFFYPKTDYQKDIISIFKSHKMGEGDRVFMSGSDVFWVNSYLPLMQVRGTNDNASIHPYWSHGSYQVREGEDRDLTSNWLKIFGSQYILVNQPESREPFHDFKQQQKFDLFELIDDKSGNKLYKIPDVWKARVVDEKILKLKKPQNGADEKIITQYVNSFKSEAYFTYLPDGDILVKDIGNGKGLISLSVTYDPSWKIAEGNGKLISDVMGNIVIVPSKTGEKEFNLHYERGATDWVIPLISFLLGTLFLWKYTIIYSGIKKLMPKVHLGLGEEEEY